MLHTKVIFFSFSIVCLKRRIDTERDSENQIFFDSICFRKTSFKNVFIYVKYIRWPNLIRVRWLAHKSLIARLEFDETLMCPKTLFFHLYYNVWMYDVCVLWTKKNHKTFSHHANIERSLWWAPALGLKFLFGYFYYIFFLCQIDDLHISTKRFSSMVAAGKRNILNAELVLSISMNMMKKCSWYNSKPNAYKLVSYENLLINWPR